MTTVTTNARPRRKALAKPPAERITKKGQLIRMLGSAAGADVAAISAKLGWQAHTVRAALTGLRNAGHDVVAEKPGQGKPTRYRIVGTPAATVSPDPAATDAHETADAR
ncbi:DUF3489 domain-containing protein [Defluviimonas sp. WL0050]|uniref:DUF3489 domain-containing protein n=1 Tax=Albidovulum litorale TaxID=2984134 RepID=A0ABT2ZSS8_9RHOB|nr:DUF3489 domain-containing protein [Defluviimonas sp. WL0050]MCV2874206.1 DUF3489 domain-containing protein [Defluviimonas sp. WL0050]